MASPFRYADGRATTHKAEAAAGSSDAAPALPMDNSRASAPGVISSNGPPAAPSYKEGSCAFSHTIYQVNFVKTSQYAQRDMRTRPWLRQSQLCKSQHQHHSDDTCASWINRPESGRLALLMLFSASAIVRGVQPSVFAPAILLVDPRWLASNSLCHTGTAVSQRGVSPQGAQAQGILGTGRPSPGTPTPVRSSTQIVAQSWLAAAVTAAFSNLGESEAEEVYFCGDSWDSLLSEDLGAAAPAASSPELPQPAFLPRPLGDYAILHAP